MFEITQARTPQEFKEARNLFEEYISGLGVDLAFQNVETELRSIELLYAEPHGCTMLVKTDGNYVGCIALKRLSDLICEMKRLYLRPEARGNGLGLRLVERIIEKARSLGYQKLRLDTLPSMKSARALYKRMGFYEIEPYYESPIVGTSFMELLLTEL